MTTPPTTPRSYRTLDQADLHGKRVLLRAGFDVPIENGAVTDATRIEALLPTMRAILDGGASLILLAHQGRPKDAPDPAFSQQPLVPVLEAMLHARVLFAPSCVGPEAKRLADALQPGEVLLLENLRFDPREKKNDPAFAQELAALGNLYVNDAFTNCHRDHASMVGVPKLLPAFIGLQLMQEVAHLSLVLDEPEHPVTLVISGAKMETKVPVVRKFLQKGDDILLGGCIANTFIAAKGCTLGTSKYEQEFVAEAAALLQAAGAKGSAAIHVPEDVVVATAPDADAVLDVPVASIPQDCGAYDVGTLTVDAYVKILRTSKTIVWNGPLGMYEREHFAGASRRIAEAIADATAAGAVSIIGGGDTIDFHAQEGLPLEAYTFVSTGGGAMLEFIAGTPFRSLDALRQ